MAEHRNRTFHNRTLVLDGESFHDCRFINADLRYKGTAPFELRGCRFEGYFNFEFDREGVGAADMARMIEGELARYGYDRQFAAGLAQAWERIWMFHTLLPRSPRS